MKANPGWQYRPYRPLNQAKEALAPFICRLAPFETGVEVQLLDNGCPEVQHIVKVRPAGSDVPWQETQVALTAVIDGLVTDTDYEIVAARAGDPAAQSAVRLFRTGKYPGRVVNYLHPKDTQYNFSGCCLCTPSIVRLPSGTLLTSMDLFDFKAPQRLTIICRSRDRGATWEYVTDLYPCYWGTLFVHRNVLYMLSFSTENGDMLIGASYDEGETWTRPVTLFPGGGLGSVAGWQHSGMPMLEHAGKLMTAVEYGTWFQPEGFGVCTLWINAEDDLLDPMAWNLSEMTYYDKNWPGAPEGGNPFLLEGNLYVDRQGRVTNLLRYQMSSSTPNHGCACYMTQDINDLNAAPQFAGILPMPSGANTKTYVLYDPISDKYWAIGNLVTDDAKPCMRNVVALMASDDGYDWRITKMLADYSALDAEKVGMQYHCFVIDGDDILWLSRTAFNDARSFHDANCQTFHLIENFRATDT